MIVAVQQRWLKGSVVNHLQIPTELKGHAVGLTIQPPGCATLEIWGVYMPTEAEAAKTVQVHMQNDLAKAEAHGHIVVMAGDFNAALFDSDRPTGATCTHMDRLHRQWLQEANLTPIDWPSSTSARVPTFSSASNTTYHSRIDDVLLSSKVCTPAQTHKLEALITTEDSDHRPLLASLSLQHMPFYPPPQLVHTEQQHQPRLKTPVTKEDMQKYKEMLSIQTDAQSAGLEASLDMLLYDMTTIRDEARENLGHTCTPSKEILAKHFSKEAIDNLAAECDAMESQMIKVAQETCTYTCPSTDGRRFAARIVNRKYKNLIQEAVHLRQALAALSEWLAAGSTPAGPQEIILSSLTGHTSKRKAGYRLPTMPEDSEEAEWQAWRHTCQERLIRAKQEPKRLRKDLAKKESAKYKTYMRRMYATSRKRAHKAINQGSQPRVQLTAVLKPGTKELVTSREGILQETHKFFQDQARPVNGKQNRTIPTNRGRTTVPMEAWSQRRA